MADQYETSNVKTHYIEVALIRWVLPTSTKNFIKRVHTLINRIGPIKTDTGVIVFRNIQPGFNGWFEIKGDWLRSGELQTPNVDMLDLVISELEPNRIEVTFQSKLLLPNYVAFRAQLATMIDIDYPSTRIVQSLQANTAKPASKRRKGGPIPTPDDVVDAILKEWDEVRGRESQESFCNRKGIGVSTLGAWQRKRKR